MRPRGLYKEPHKRKGQPIWINKAKIWIYLMFIVYKYVAYKYPINIAYPFRIKAISNKMVSFFKLGIFPQMRTGLSNIYFHT